MDSSIQNSYNKQRGHIRSASLENANSFISKNTLGLPLVQPGFTGTLKSRNEQKRLRNKFGSQSNLEDYVQQSRSKFQNIRSMFEATKSSGSGECETQQMPQQAQPQQLQQQHQQQQQQSQQQQQMHPINQINHSQYQQNIHMATVMHAHPELGHRGSSATSNYSTSSSSNHHHHHHPQLKRTTMGGGVEYSDSLNIVETDSSGSTDRVNRSEKSDQATNLLRPIAFKPIPFEPDYSIPVRYNELGDRYGSTPSLAPVQGSNLRFGSTTDLRHGYSSSNSYCNNLMARRRCSRSLKINDSMESIRHTPDSDAISQNSTLKSNCGNTKYIISEQFDMTPSPSDSGISELEAALKDRDSELSYLRQTMEHNEKDKEAYWENETKRLKAYYENQQKEFLLKIKKMEQMLTLQSFQFKQNKLRITENTNRLKEQFGDLKKESELLKSENEGLKTSERSIRDCINQLEEKTRIMDGLIGNLKAQLEENEWTVCQRNGEIALLKNQLKEANLELTAKDQEILHLKHDQTTTTTTPSAAEPTPPSPSIQAQEVEISQLNRIIILKDQVILALTNELGKLRKELSDLAIFHEYGEEPSGKLSRLKYQIDKISNICQKNQMNNEEKQKDLSPKTIDDSNLEVIMNCLQIVPPFIEPPQRPLERHLTPESRLAQMSTDIQNFVYGTLNLPDIAQNSQYLDEKMASKDEVSVLRKELAELRGNFEMERHQWAEEKEKVLKYQKQLQMHYINMYQKIKDLDSSNSSEAV
ncbi:leucine zipper putative tumor suppressor 2 homolog isoform X2 [Episyrphus balteatus]|uniref:leucine zipper putative tumor suppressor 2 homolog isoform X2 n=1 Tax=Episyrphus balteatus TaxID=286459 RepID=UPI002486970C|nr:leucine zipper putative tumor suppressor 2 homolog isoform X2 [Episyrphus balteatus]